MFGAWVGAPKRGFASLRQMSRWVDTPPFITTPSTETINPQRGGNGRDPHGETPPKRREGGHSACINYAKGRGIDSSLLKIKVDLKPAGERVSYYMNNGYQVLTF